MNTQTLEINVLAQFGNTLTYTCDSSPHEYLSKKHARLFLTFTHRYEVCLPYEVHL